MRAVKRALAAAALAGLVVVPGAASHIVIHECIGGVSLYDRSARVERTLGAPVRKTTNGAVRVWHYPGLTVGVDIPRDVVVYVATTKQSERTAGGTGVGTTEAALRATFPKLRCSGKPRTCELGRAPITFFSMKNGKVARILIDATSAFDDAPFPKRDPRC